MRKLDLKSYTVSVKNQLGVIQLQPYDFKNVLANILVHPSLGLNGPELLDVTPLANRIERSNMEVILTEEDYLKIINTLKKFRGFSKNDTHFLERIYNCPEIPDDDIKIIEFSNN